MSYWRPMFAQLINPWSFGSLEWPLENTHYVERIGSGGILPKRCRRHTADIGPENLGVSGRSFPLFAKEVRCANVLGDRSLDRFARWNAGRFLRRTKSAGATEQARKQRRKV